LPEKYRSFINDESRARIASSTPQPNRTLGQGSKDVR